MSENARIKMRAWMALTLALGLAACGFQPLYGSGESGRVLSSIVVGTVDGKTGHVLKAQLERRMSAGRAAGAAPAYTLSVALQERLEPIGLRIDASATRTDLTLIANYVLRDANGLEAAKGKIETTVGYDVPASAFGEVSAQNDARERAGETMAELIRAELATRIAPTRQ
jgi:LPS-assembly lipoprotein